SLLPKQLLAGASHIGPAPCIDRPHASSGQVHQHHFMEQLLVDLATKVVGIDRLFADLLTSRVIDGYTQHVSIQVPSLDTTVAVPITVPCSLCQTLFVCLIVM